MSASEDVMGIVIVLVVCEVMMCGGNGHSIIWRAAGWLQDFVDRHDRLPAPALADDEEEETPVVENVFAEEDEPWKQ